MTNNLEKMFPDHKCSLTLTHNQHKDYYQSVISYLSDREIPLDDWVSEEQWEKAIETDSMWELQWYPDTPIGFIRLFACDLDVLLEECHKGTK